MKLKPLTRPTKDAPDLPPKFTDTKEKYAIIGAGPSGLGTARCFLLHGIPFDGFESAGDVGGLWNIQNPHSTIYETAHLISSKRMTEFKHFPMQDHVPDFPHHSDLCQYFQDYAEKFGLYEHFHFNTRIQKIEPVNEFWEVFLPTGEKLIYKGIVIANGTLSKPNIPDLKGSFDGEIIHSASYKSPDIFEGKRVLIVGAGNSGCDIAVDAVHRAKYTAMSVRRGYHFVPKYIFGKPADTMGGLIQLPRKWKQKIDKFLLRLFLPNPQKFGFPEPDHKLYESHPIVNSVILHHLGHGDMFIKSNVEELKGKKVRFADGTEEEYDMILLATGYQLNYPFIKKEHLNWKKDAPDLYLNIFHPDFNQLFVIGMVEATGLGWQGRYEQAELVARFILNQQHQTKKARKFIRKKRRYLPDTSGGYRYLDLPRMAYYVHKDTYRTLMRKHLKKLNLSWT